MPILHGVVVGVEALREEALDGLEGALHAAPAEREGLAGEEDGAVDLSWDYAEIYH